MGGGISSQNIDCNQKLSFAKSLRNNYDAYVEEGLSDDIILERVMRDYRNLLESLPVDTTQSPNNLNLDLDNNDKNYTSCGQHLSSSPLIKSKKVNTRRRSFDNINLTRGNLDPPAPLFNIISQNKSLSSSSIQPSSSSSAASSVAKVLTDSWESISQQPYCNVCAMAFKTSMFLSRHIKYSDQHSRNLNKRQTVLEASSAPLTPTDSLTDRTSENSSPQDEQKERSIISIDNRSSLLSFSQSSSTAATVSASTKISTIHREGTGPSLEGIHYKLLYGGSKFFWMSDKEIDLSIYEFFEPLSTIEIIPYDLDLNKELPRLYLNMAAIVLPILNNELDDHDDATNATKRRDQELTRFIVSRLHLTTQPVDNHNNSEFSNFTSSSFKQVIFLNNSIDPIDITTPLLSSPPSSLIPVKVTRRRNTIGDLIEETKINRRDSCGNLVEEMLIEIITQSSSQVQ